MDSHVTGEKPDWTKILIDAVEKPGIISDAYRRFWNYSVGNQLLAMFECLSRKIEPGPLNTFRGWQRCGRSVKRGEKALTLCLPIQVKKPIRACTSEEISVADGAEQTRERLAVTRFVYKNRWFVLCQTEGDDYVPADLPEWNEKQALASLMIERIAFDHTDGNV